MPSTFSPDKNYELMAQGENDGVWGTKTNSNWSIVDLNFGGRLNIDASGSGDITISPTQAENVYHNITGTLTGNIHYKLPNKGSFYFLNNQTTGNFTLTAIPVGGTGTIIPQASSVMVFVNPDNTTLTPAIVIAQSVFIGGTTTGGANAQQVTTASNFTLTAGYMLIAEIGVANTTQLTLQVNGGDVKNVFIQGSSDIMPMTGGECAINHMAVFLYDGTQWQLLNPSPTIEISMGLSVTPPSGKLVVNGDSIGDATSGATHNASYFANLYAYWWNNVSNTYAPVATGRGVSAAADFAAHKKLTMPNWADYSPYGVGSSLASPGATGGSLTIASQGTITGDSGTSGATTLTSGQIPTLTYTIAGNAYDNTNDFMAAANAGTTSGAPHTLTNLVTTSAGGGSHTHPPGTLNATFTGILTSVLQPSFGVYYYISI